MNDPLEAAKIKKPAGGAEKVSSEWTPGVSQASPVEARAKNPPKIKPKGPPILADGSTVIGSATEEEFAKMAIAAKVNTVPESTPPALPENIKVNLPAEFQLPTGVLVLPADAEIEYVEIPPPPPKKYLVLETRVLNWCGALTTLQQGGIVSEAGYGVAGIQQMIRQGFKLKEVEE